MTSVGSQAFTIVCALLAILGLIFLFFWLFSWLRKKTGGNFGSGRNIKVRECVSIAQDKQLVIVTVGGKTMLIGVTAGSMRKLCDLDEDDLAAEPGQGGQESGGFMANLRTAIAQRGQGASPEELERWQSEHPGQDGQDEEQGVRYEGRGKSTGEEKGAKEDRRNEK